MCISLSKRGHVQRVKTFRMVPATSKGCFSVTRLQVRERDWKSPEVLHRQVCVCVCVCVRARVTPEKIKHFKLLFFSPPLGTPPLKWPSQHGVSINPQGQISRASVPPACKSDEIEGDYLTHAAARKAEVGAINRRRVSPGLQKLHTGPGRGETGSGSKELQGRSELDG